ncbi:MAG: threonine synthase [Kiritimatiellae bacterium]|nr:threonine synthase [Kiritimatiellia bacterium]
MRYISTRGGTEPVGFQDAVMMGLARDGGLLLPVTIPDVRDRLAAWSGLSYQRLAFEVMRLYIGDIADEELAGLIDRSYRTFRHAEVAPVVRVGPVRILELFHGPTLAFKDIALQFLGNLFESILSQSDRELNILAATSGDTGSAAIHGVRGRARIRIFVMHPYGKISPTQERQMTSVLDDNVFNIGVEGSFDDCQRIMKAIFRDLPFKDAHSLGSVNSINWARLLAQIVYYFYAWFRVVAETGAARVRFAVPTGNFGDIFAGYLAARMGLPIGLLVLATNENDILARFFASGIYELGSVRATISPSMDIQVASNFERYLYYRTGADSRKLTGLMQEFGVSGRLAVEPAADGRVDELFAAGSGDTARTLALIGRYYEQYGCVLDPHTAVGVATAEGFLSEAEPMICLGTAHPAKFSRAVRDAVGRDVAHHEILDRLAALPTRCKVLPASESAVRAFLEERLGL